MKTKKTIAKWIFVIVLLLAIIYTFRNSAGEILLEIRTTTPLILCIICISSCIMHCFEGWITYSLAKKYNPYFRYRSGVFCAFYCSFYRLATLGSGAGVAAVVYLGRHGIAYSKAIGVYMVQYVLHKISIALFSGICFVLNWRFMIRHYHTYGWMLLAAYGITICICIGLVLFVASGRVHRLLLFLMNRINRSGKWTDKIERQKQEFEMMEEASAELLTDRTLMFVLIIRNLIKFCFWYGIPFIIVFSSHTIRLLDSFGITSLSVMTAAVLPTPAGVGAVEYIMTMLFAVVLGNGKAGAVTILYRIATFIFPF